MVVDKRVVVMVFIVLDLLNMVKVNYFDYFYVFMFVLYKLFGNIKCCVLVFLMSFEIIRLNIKG